MNEITVVAVCIGLIVYSLIDRKLEASSLSLPIFFSLFGLLLGDLGLNLVDTHVDTELLAVFAEITLVLVLFSDAAKVDIKSLRTNIAVPVRMLIIGMPLTILFGAAVAQWASPQAPFVMALLVAAILTPTDAALSQSITSSKTVPLHIKQAINVESGLNDGLVVPVVILAAILTAHAMGGTYHDAPDNLGFFILTQLTLGPLVGVGVGLLLGKLIDYCVTKNLTDNDGQAIVVLAGALLSFVLAELIGGNGFIAAFLGGLTVGNVMKTHGEYSFEFMESEGKILTILTFIIFGALLLPKGIAHANWQAVIVACLFLTIVRIIPIMLSLTGVNMSFRHKLALGWFGPRGLASILFALLIDERFDIPGYGHVLACVVLTVALSVLLHGISASPIARRFGGETST